MRPVRLGSERRGPAGESQRRHRARLRNASRQVRGTGNVPVASIHYWDGTAPCGCRPAPGGSGCHSPGYAMRWRHYHATVVSSARDPFTASVMDSLHSKIRTELLATRDKMVADGSLPSSARLEQYHSVFRAEFGPEILRRLEGKELLERMHAHGNRDSLVYWLEFKNDETFPAIFGSIAGGSALKFGVYRRVETGTWATKGTGPVPKDISLNEAIEIARNHRDQIVAAVEAVARIPADADDDQYYRLQRDLARVAPDIQDTAWGHKYLSLIFPDVLDDFHVENYQRYNLIRVLQIPPLEGESLANGRYVSAGRFVSLARELDLPVHVTTTLLNARHGAPRSYWRIGTTDDERVPGKYWPLMRDAEIIAIGWPALGDLSPHTTKEDFKEIIAEALQRHYPNGPQMIGKKAGEIKTFAARISEGDRVVAAAGETMLGVGEVAGSYRFDASTPFPHHRPVLWHSLSEWKAHVAEALRTTVGAIKKPGNQLEIERRILDETNTTRPPGVSVTKPVSIDVGGPLRAPLPRLSGIPGEIQSILERKCQVILYGPPGTGKTHWALRAARDLAALRAFRINYDSLTPQQRDRVSGKSDAALVRVIGFHPDYGYEDFIEGYRPRVSTDGSLTFALVPGVFRRLCADAESSPELDFYLVIDEINRGDVPRIFGELLTLLERDKRGESVLLPMSGDSFRVPSNIFVLGTMNTADRSIALLDVALRRRFGFIELLPDYSLFKSSSIGGLPLGVWLEDLNSRVRELGGGDGRSRQIGHAFFLNSGSAITTHEQFTAVLRDDVVPLLEEYAYGDFSQLSDVLGSGLVDSDAQRIRRELFEPGRGPDLVTALLRPEIVTAAAAVVTLSAETLSSDDDEPENEEAENGSGQGERLDDASSRREVPRA